MSDATDRTPANRQESDDVAERVARHRERKRRDRYDAVMKSLSERTAKAKGEDDGNDKPDGPQEARRRVVVGGGAAVGPASPSPSAVGFVGRRPVPSGTKPQGRKLPLTERGRDTGRSEFARSA